MCVGLVGSRTSAELVVAPRNTVVVHGSPARLMCQTAVPDATSPPAAAVSWKFTSVDGDQQKFIYNDNGLNPKYERRGVSVVVDATAGSYALQFDAVRLDDAGTYTCQNDAASGDPRAAWLAVLGPHIQLISLHSYYVTVPNAIFSDIDQSPCCAHSAHIEDSVLRKMPF